MMNCAFAIKKNTASLSHWTELSVLVLGLGDVLETHCQDGFCFDIIAVNPSFITRDDVLYTVFISICVIDKLSTDINTAVFLIFTQPARNKYGCNRTCAQIWSKNALTRGF
jgi:hypothetical protein